VLELSATHIHYLLHFTVHKFHVKGKKFRDGERNSLIEKLESMKHPPFTWVYEKKHDYPINTERFTNYLHVDTRTNTHAEQDHLH
jgi:hypothetical protein